MSTRDALLIRDVAELPHSLRARIDGVSFATFLFVEAGHLDGLSRAAMLSWLGVRESAFAKTEERWSHLVGDELARQEGGFDETYEDLLGRALSLWARPVEPLDRDVEAWMTFQRHALAAEAPIEMARDLGLTPGDEVRLARLWRRRLDDPEIMARAAAALSGPLLPLPALSISPIPFPPTLDLS